MEAFWYVAAVFIWVALALITDFSEHVTTYAMTVEEFMKHAVQL